MKNIRMDMNSINEITCEIILDSFVSTLKIRFDTNVHLFSYFSSFLITSKTHSPGFEVLTFRKILTSLLRLSPDAIPVNPKPQSGCSGCSEV